jgi:hypothetical protein
MASPSRDVARNTGLSTDEVAERIATGQTNRVPQQTSRPLSAIVRANVLTRFNAILGGLLVAVAAATVGVVCRLAQQWSDAGSKPDARMSLPDHLFERQIGQSVSRNNCRGEALLG